jgi:hypothetical protein
MWTRLFFVCGYFSKNEDVDFYERIILISCFSWEEDIIHNHEGGNCGVEHHLFSEEVMLVTEVSRSVRIATIVTKRFSDILRLFVQQYRYR